MKLFKWFADKALEVVQKVSDQFNPFSIQFDFNSSDLIDENPFPSQEEFRVAKKINVAKRQVKPDYSLN